MEPTNSSSSGAARTSGYSTAITIAPEPTSPRQEDISTLTCLTFNYKEMAERYHWRLREAAMEVAALREENEMLREANADLTRKLSMFNSSFWSQGYLAYPASSSVPFLAEFQRLNIEDDTLGGGLPAGLTDSSPTSVLSFEEPPPIDNARMVAAAESTGTSGTGRIALPKSIAIRSAGFLKMSQPGRSGRISNHPSRVRLSSPVSGMQRVRVSSGKEEASEVEVEAFKQGTFKTELCNKWQQSGECPYNDHCQFAHGIEELRPVIRHPRYKTELCKMVVAGETCPYGHRCHFRHALTDEERVSATRLQ
ncbi:zinc finger CCCH domain-containing protein 15-like isoform X1 [Nymphaea colorata]|nr:zinc finger CCCH domain-containing protein 15-like isoform X1 [Nymphaea colorata]